MAKRKLAIPSSRPAMLAPIVRPAVAHHADVPEEEAAAGDIAFRRRRLGRAAGCARIGVSHYLVPPGARQMPLHVHGDEEEIVYVLGGSGVGVEGAEADAAYPLRAGDVVVHRADGAPHTRVAGPDGLELIVFGSGSETSLTWLPRARVMWAGPRWVPLDSPHPFKAEAAAGVLAVPPLPVDGAARPPHVLALADVPAEAWTGFEVTPLGRAAGAVRAGLNHVRLPAGARGAEPHCHAIEEEAFVVLAGSGTVRLGEAGHPLRPGDVVARPPATGVAHTLIAGPDGLTYLAYGTREPGDAVYRPERREVRLRALGVTLPLPD